MPFNITQFKSVLEHYGGPSKNNLFEVRFSGAQTPWADANFGNNELRFFCKTATFPGISLSVFDYRPNNIEVPQSLPFAVNHEQLECIFIVDDTHNVYSYFHRWMQEVVNYNTDGSSPDSVNPTFFGIDNHRHYPYEIGYKKDYAQTMTITKYAKHPTLGQQKPEYTCTLYGVFPTSIGSTSLSWEDDSYTVLPVSLSYSSFTMSGVQQNIIPN